MHPNPNDQSDPGGYGSRIIPFARTEHLPVGINNSTRQDGSVIDERKLMLISERDDHEDHWRELGEFHSRFLCVSIEGGVASQLVRLAWSIGDPLVACANGGEAGVAALRAQAIAPGAFPTLFLIDFGAQHLHGFADQSVDAPASLRHIGRVVIVRGRESTRVSHEDAVRAREMLLAAGADCRLVEPESCGNDAGDLCYGALVAAIDWLAFGGT